MKRFITHIITWILTCIAAVSLVWLVNVPTSYRYAFAKNEGCEIEKIHARIEADSVPIQYAFLGASHTGCGVNDELINEALGIEPGAVINLSYCGGHRNIHTQVLLDLLVKHKPKRIFLDVVRDEPKGSHRDFGFIADFTTVLSAPILFNPDYFRDVWHSFQLHYFYIQDVLYGRINENTNQVTGTIYGFNDVFVGTKPVEQLEAYKTKEFEKHSDWKANGFSFLEDYKQKLSLSYVKAFAKICQEHKIKLTFIYIPAYGMVAPEPIHLNEYKALGDILIPPKEIFNNPENWIDEQHLNSKGSKEFSLWLAAQL